MRVQTESLRYKGAGCTAKVFAEDYKLVIDIGGTPDSVRTTGHMEGFFSNWDATAGELSIKSDEVTREIAGASWLITAMKGTEEFQQGVKYNVIRGAPIFEVLPTIYLYRNVPINFDVIIRNIPPVVVSHSDLLGLKSETLEHGIKVGGLIPADATFSFRDGNIQIIVPDESAQNINDITHNYPYEIQAGSPPAIREPRFTPKGRYGILDVTEVANAFGYEYTLEAGDNPTWRVHNDNRPAIDPGDIEVEPGNLAVTLTFPHIAGATDYEYQLETASSVGV